ncbi:ABC transporter substrate-binding protein [Conexibacter stalactiti]|uniref:ABC transporter substrate-binding protein n=1 Tax=Conexibacter stalactiti TaxID=1940611 RepID=A0ABU4HME9_9ACTN|nr:ABC transporter substrate-binding protein [Conexibacter stalactiti]MDW5593902.1 ABC transporter substrate-binding protein [Conexibacter stalactiti]MEC5034544.1 ABC transporter substrate-binding protein [Conexibacter stalactiti]
MAGQISRAQFITRGVAAGVSLTVLGSVLAACGGESAGGGAATDVATGAAPTPVGRPPATPTGTLVYGNAEPPTANYWDPAAGFGLVDEQVASLVHDTLLAHDADGNVHPQLATRVDRVSDVKVRITLRDGVRFQDGTPLTSADVAATFDRLGARDSRLAQSNTVSPLHCVVHSPTSLDIVTDKPFGPMEAALAYVKILPKSDIDHPANFRRRALGAGPYRFVSYEGNTVTLTANDDYWGEKPHALEIKFEYIEDLEARTNALLTGDIQIMSRVGSEQLARVRDDDAYYTTKTSPPSQVCSLYQHNGALRDAEVRQAIAHAVDREAIARGILKGIFPVGQSSLPTTSPMYEALDTRFPYDPEKAKALIGDRAVELRMATATLFSHQVEIDQAIAQYLEAVGIKVNLTKLEVGAFRTSYNQYDLSLNTLGSFTGDPDFIFGFYAGGTGEAVFHLRDPKIVDLIAAQREAVGDARPPKVTELASYLWDQQTTLYLSDEIWYFIVSSRVQNYERAPLIGEPLAAKAWLEAA